MEAYMKLLGTKNQSKKYLFVLNLIAVLKKLPRFWNYCDIMSYYSSPTNKFSHHLLCMSDFWILWNIQNSMGSKNTILDPADLHCMEKIKTRLLFSKYLNFVFHRRKSVTLVCNEESCELSLSLNAMCQTKVTHLIKYMLARTKQHF